MTRTLIIDVGKSNAKLLLSDAADGRVVWSAERPAGAPPYRREVGCDELDVEGIERWILGCLADAAEAGASEGSPIDTVVPIGHGAAMVLLDGSGALLAAPDYEDPRLGVLAQEYERLRDPFAATFSPRLPNGLNLGLQLMHLQRQAPALWSRTAVVLPWPQYWAWRLCGVAASELTSLGCHTDLWRPGEARFSDLAERQGWTRLFAPLRRADAVLGMATASLGLGRECRVLCGMHDSSASFHALRGSAQTVISSGTWTIAMTGGGAVGRLREERDMLANLDLDGEPVAVARAMGGREYAAIAGHASVAPTQAALREVLRTGAMALPSFAQESGPFRGRSGRVLGEETLGPEGRAALATLYVALLADEMLDLLGVSGSVMIDGPLAANALFGPVLQALRPTDAVTTSGSRDGVVIAANALAHGRRQPCAPGHAVERLRLDGLEQHRTRWRESHCREPKPAPRRN